MLKKLTLAILAAAFVVSPALAANPDGSVTLTPSKLYELIQETREQTAHITSLLRSKCYKLEERVTRLENTSPINPSDTLRIQTLEKKVHAQTEIIKLLRERLSVERIEEIERKLSGVQNQITVLHSKKADK